MGRIKDEGKKESKVSLSAGFNSIIIMGRHPLWDLKPSTHTNTQVGMYTHTHIHTFHSSRNELRDLSALYIIINKATVSRFSKFAEM